MWGSRSVTNQSVENPGNRPGRGNGKSVTPGRRRNAKERAAAVARAWREFPGKGTDGRMNFAVGNDNVVISDVQEGEDETAAWVDIWTGGPRPAFRICNPPMLVPDPEGDVEIEEPVSEGRTLKKRYREDPLHAVANVIAHTRRIR